MKIFINNQLILESNDIPYMYPGNLECPVMFQISAIDKSISLINVYKGVLAPQEVDKICDFGEM